MYAFPRPRCLLILVSGRVSTSCWHDGVPARRTRDVLPTDTPSPRRTLMTTPRACRWEGCEFNLTMEFSSDYPATAPIVKFVSRPGPYRCQLSRDAVAATPLRHRRRDVCSRFHTRRRGLLAPERLEQRAHLPQSAERARRDVARPVVAVDHDQADTLRDPGAAGQPVPRRRAARGPDALRAEPAGLRAAPEAGGGQVPQAAAAGRRRRRGRHRVRGVFVFLSRAELRPRRAVGGDTSSSGSSAARV